MKFLKSVRSKLVLQYTLAITLLIAAYSAGLFYFFRQNLLSEMDRELRNDVETISMILEQGKELKSLQAGSFSTANWLTEVWTLDGQRVFTSGRADAFLLGQAGFECLKDPKPKDVRTSHDLSVRTLCARSEAFPDRYIVRVARLTEIASHHLRQFFSLMLFGIPLVLLFSVFAGYILARRTLKPISDITERAKVISADKLSERLPVANAEDELGELALTFNQTFERLERSFSQMKRFTSDASHEMRTPLAAIRTMGEVALRKVPNVQGYQDVVGNILEETTRLQNLCESLLTLSRAESGHIQFKCEKVNAFELTQEIVQILSVLAEEKNQILTISIDRRLSVWVDPGFFRQALMNLVDNAIKYSPINSEIAITVHQELTQIHFAIKDQGPGIAIEHQERIFDRFYRIDSGRSRASGGAGLGLAISAWIVHMHKGTIRLKSDLGKGCEFLVSVQGEA